MCTVVIASINNGDEREIFESDGELSVCVTLDHLPTQDIVSITVSTSSGSAEGIECIHYNYS